MKEEELTEWSEGRPCSCKTLRHHLKLLCGVQSEAVAEVERLVDEVERLRGLLVELDSFEFVVVHKAGCGEPCDCGWTSLERRIMAALGGEDG